MMAMTSLKPPTPDSDERQDFDLPALLLGEARVHAEDLGGEERGLVAAGAGADFEDDVLLVVRILGQQQHLQFFFDRRQARLRARSSSSCGHGANVGIGFGEHGLRVGDALLRPLVVAEPVHDRLQVAVLLGDLLIFFVIVDDLVGGHLAAQLFVAGGNLFQAFKHRGFLLRAARSGDGRYISVNLEIERGRRRAMAAGAARGACRENE